MKRILAVIVTTCMLVCTSMVHTSIRAMAVQERLQIPQNLRWDGNIAMWDPVPHADYYQVFVFIYSGNRSGNTGGGRITECYHDCTDTINMLLRNASIMNDEHVRVAFRVTAVSENYDMYVNSDMSPESEPRAGYVPPSIAGMTVQFRDNSILYRGMPVEPAFTLVDQDGYPVVQQGAYTYVFENNDKVGKARLIVTGGYPYYSGTETFVFEITESSHYYKTTITKRATCTEPGESEAVCSGCGDRIVSVIPALRHNLVVIDRVDATVLKKGLITKRCTRCGHEINEIIPKVKAIVRLLKTKATLKKGKTIRLSIKSKSVGDSVRSWSSSNKKVASVSGGLVKAMKKGTAIITLTMKSGCKAKCKVKVT